MKKIVLASALVLSGMGSAAFAQTAERPVGVAPPTQAEREAVRGAGEPAAARPFNPDDVRPDDVNGLEVPRMKNPKDGGRDR